MTVMLFRLFNQADKAAATVGYSEFLSMVDSGSVTQVVVQGNNLTGSSAQGQVKTYTPTDPDLITYLRSKGVKITAKPEENSIWFQVFLISWMPMLLLIGVWIFFMRQMQSGGGKALSFGKSRARLMNESQEKITFEDVAGIDEAKEELHEIIEFLSDPKKFTRLGGRIPKGSSWWAHPAQERPCLQGPLPERPVSLFSASAVPILLRCSWAWAPPG